MEIKIKGREIDRAPVLDPDLGECVFTKISLPIESLAEQLTHAEINSLLGIKTGTGGTLFPKVMSEEELHNFINAWNDEKFEKNKSYPIEPSDIPEFARILSSKLPAKSFPISACCNASVALISETSGIYKCLACGQITKLADWNKPTKVEYCECKESIVSSTGFTKQWCKICDRQIKPRTEGIELPEPNVYEPSTIKFLRAILKELRAFNKKE